MSDLAMITLFLHVSKKVFSFANSIRALRGELYYYSSLFRGVGTWF